MPRKPREKSKSGIYHIMLRGANRQEIFHDDQDCLKFLNIIDSIKKKSGMKVYGWCLMRNHVHLLLKEGKEEISLTMKRLGVSFAYFYNLKYKTTGHLFQDRYRSERVERDGYLLTVIRYIHQNPVKAGLVQKPEEWRWSSCHIYYGQQYDFPFLLDSEFILGMFSENSNIAMARFMELNETKNEDNCLEDIKRKRLTDEEGREKIITIIKGYTLAEIKTLPKEQRDKILIKIKKIAGLSQRQAARILGISENLIFKA